MRSRVLGMAMGLVLLTAGSAAAQVAWDSPMLMPPQAKPGLGISLVDPAAGDLGVMATWRSGRAPQSIGFRVGLAEDWSNDLSVFGGVDAQGGLVRSSRDFPLDMDWVLGAGIGVGDYALLSFPAGITVGKTFTGDGVSFTPYLTPRLILDAWFGDSDRFGPGDDSDLDLDLAVDLGVDIGFQPGWLVRFGATFGDRDALAIGLVF